MDIEERMCILSDEITKCIISINEQINYLHSRINKLETLIELLYTNNHDNIKSE